MVRDGVLSVVLFVTLLTESLALAQEEITLHWYAGIGNPDEIAIWTELVNEYNMSHSGVTVEMARPSGSYYEGIFVLLASGSPIDLMWLNNAYWTDFATQGLVIPLDEYLENDPTLSKETFPPILIDTFTLDGDGMMYVIPKDHGGTSAIWYNIDMIEAAGLALPSPEWTWEDFREYAKALTRDDNQDGIPERYGTQPLIDGETNLGLFLNHRGQMMIRNFGGQVYSDDFSSSRLDDPQTVAALEYIIDLKNVDGVTGGEFESGTAAMRGFQHQVVGYWMRQNGTLSNIGVEWLPKGPGGQNQTAGSTGFAIAATSWHKQEAYDFVSWVLSAEIQERFARHFRWGAARKDMFELQFLYQIDAGWTLERNWRRVWVESLINPAYEAHPIRVPIGVNEIRRVVNEGFLPALNGERSVREAVELTKPLVDRILSEYY